LTLNPLLSPTVHRVKLLSQLHPIPALIYASTVVPHHYTTSIANMTSQVFEVTERYKSSNYYWLENDRRDNILGREVLPGNATAQV